MAARKKTTSKPMPAYKPGKVKDPLKTSVPPGGRQTPGAKKGSRKK